MNICVNTAVGNLYLAVVVPKWLTFGEVEMLGIPVRYLLKHPVTGVADLLADPVETWTTVHDAYVAEARAAQTSIPYDPDQTGKRLTKPSTFRGPAMRLRSFGAMARGHKRAGGKGDTKPAPRAFNGGTMLLILAGRANRPTRHLKPRKVVETGVAHGVTSRFILEALKRNGQGHLWSIDLPPLERSWRQEVGVAVGDGHLDRVDIHQGVEQAPSSRIALQPRSN